MRSMGRCEHGLLLCKNLPVKGSQMKSHREVERSQGLRVDPAATAQWLAAASRKASSAKSKQSAPRT